MGGSKAARQKNDLVAILQHTYSKMQKRLTYKYLLILLGLPIHLIVVIVFLFIKRKNTIYSSTFNEIKEALLVEGCRDELKQEFTEQLVRKQAFFAQKVSKQDTEKQADKLTEAQFLRTISQKTDKALEQKGEKKFTYVNFFQMLLSKPLFPTLYVYSRNTDVRADAIGQ